MGLVSTVTNEFFFLTVEFPWVDWMRVGPDNSETKTLQICNLRGLS